jgi:hypothetical protein
MFVVWFHRYDRLGCNLVCYIAQIIYAHYHGYYIKIINNEFNYPKYPESKFYIMLLDYIVNILNPNQQHAATSLSDGHKSIASPTDDEILYNFNKYDVQMFCGFVTQEIECDLISYFHKHIYNDLDFNILYDSFDSILSTYNFNQIYCHLRLDDVAHKTDFDGSICSRYYKLLIENDKLCHNKFYDYVNNHSPLSKEKINIMLNDVKLTYPNIEIFMITSPISDTGFKEYRTISHENVDIDLFILCMAKKSILSRSMFALCSLFFSEPKEYCYLPSWGFFVTCGLNTKYDNNKFKYIY